MRWYVVILPSFFDDRKLLKTTVDFDWDLYRKRILYIMMDDAINDNVADIDLHSAMAIFSWSDSARTARSIFLDDGWSMIEEEVAQILL